MPISYWAFLATMDFHLLELSSIPILLWLQEILDTWLPKPANIILDQHCPYCFSSALPVLYNDNLVLCFFIQVFKRKFDVLMQYLGYFWTWVYCLQNNTYIQKYPKRYVPGSWEKLCIEHSLFCFIPPQLQLVG